MDTHDSVLIRAQEGDCIWLHGQQSFWSQLKEFAQPGSAMFVSQQKLHAEALPGRVLFQHWRQKMSAAVNYCGLPIGWCPMCLQSSSIPLRTSDRSTKFLCNLCGLSKRDTEDHTKELLRTSDRPIGPLSFCAIYVDFQKGTRKTAQRRVKISCRHVVERANKTCAATWLWSPQKTLACVKVPLDLVFRCGVLAALRLSWHAFCLCSFSDHELNADAQLWKRFCRKPA